MKFPDIQIKYWFISQCVVSSVLQITAAIIAAGCSHLSFVLLLVSSMITLMTATAFFECVDFDLVHNIRKKGLNACRLSAAISKHYEKGGINDAMENLTDANKKYIDALMATAVEASRLAQTERNASLIDI